MPQDPVDWLAAQQSAMEALLADLVNADSGSADKAGVDAAGVVLEGFLRAHGLTPRRHPLALHGDAIEAALPAADGMTDRPVVLLGHRDTVFPKGEALRRPYRAENGLGFGPGISDMKAGVVVECFVLAALAQAGGGPVPVVLFNTGDEEIGSPSSEPLIAALATRARAVLNAEPAYPLKSAPAEAGRTKVITQTRKGRLGLRLEITGIPAHAGSGFRRGRSAVHDLARRVTALAALSDPDAGLTVNVGQIGGGLGANTIAAEAWAEIDIRFSKPGQESPLREAIEAALIHPRPQEGISHRLIWGQRRAPMTRVPGSRALYDLYTAAAAESGITVSSVFAGGSSDASIATGAGCPTLCRVGPNGGGAHTLDEFTRLDDLIPTAQAMLRTVQALAGRWQGLTAPPA